MSPPADRRRRLRTEATEPERVLWRALRARHIGPKFRRQHPVDVFIVDFFCVEAQLAIELDGGQHYDVGALEYDAKRKRRIAEVGVAILRFTNTDALTRTREVLEEILRHVEARSGGGGRGRRR